MQQIQLSKIENLEILKQELEEAQREYDELNDRILKRDYTDHYELQFMREEKLENSAKIERINDKIKLLQLKQDI